MRRPRLSSRAPCFFLAFAIASANPVHAQAVSLWDLNTSTMALYADGQAIVFRYREPRASLQEEGVVPGTLHFAGTVAGNIVSGTAHVFSRRCGPQPYHVTGTVTEHNRAITLTGTAPSGFDASCQAVRFREAVLVFNLLQVIPQAPPVVVGSIDRDQTAAQEQLEGIRRQRDEEQRRLSELRAFSSQRAACQRYDIPACDLALRSAHASPHDVAELARWRTVADQFRTDRYACRSGSVAACDAALASPASSQSDRPLLTSWRTAASPTNRILAGVAAYAETSVAVFADALAFVRNLPASTHLAGGLATILALALAGLAVRHRRPTAAEPGAPATGLFNDRTTPAASASPSTEQQSHHTSGKVAGPPPIPSQRAQPVPPAVRDTPGALAALELAYAYLQEVRDADRPAFDDNDTRKHHLNALALAAKQLDQAQLLDPDAILEGQDEKDIPFRLSINELKAEALVLEGTTHQTYDTRRASRLAQSHRDQPQQCLGVLYPRADPRRQHAQARGGGGVRARGRS